MKRSLFAAAAIVLLATTAQAQLLLPPPPPTAAQTTILNLSMVAVYAATCKRNNPEFDPKRDVEIAIDATFNTFGMSYLNQIGAATKRARDTVDQVGRTKFCEMADQDADIQDAVKRLRAMGASR